MAISERTPVTLKVVVAIIGVAVTVGSLLAGASSHAERIERLEARSAEHDQKIQRGDDRIDAMADDLREIKGDVKEILRGHR